MKWQATLLVELFTLFLPLISYSQSCEHLIPSLICEVAPPAKEQDRYKDNRPCLPTDISRYQTLILQAFSAYPTFVQNQFCSLKKIYIEQKFFGPAWTNPVDENKSNEILIGLRKQDLDAQVDLQSHSSWFEQQSFGGLPNFQLKPDLPKVIIQPSKTAATPFLLFTLLHELGHAFDYQRHFNLSKADPNFSESWTNIHWTDIHEIRPRFDFKNRKAICLNNCKGHYLNPQKASVLYQDIFRHGFVSQLSATNAIEDFADSFAHYVMNKYMGVNFNIYANGQKFSLNEGLNNHSFKKKMDYLERQFPHP